MVTHAPSSQSLLEPWRAASTPRSSGERRDRVAVEEVLAKAGITLDGPRRFDIRINDPRAYRAMLSGSLGFGEAYMDGWWDCEALDEAMARIFRADLAHDRPSLRTLARIALATMTNRQARGRAFDVGRAHYDVGNDVFEAMLDPDLVYTCGYWKDATDLASAQRAKLDLVCRKLGLAPGMRVLDIGCGYGAFMKHAAQFYGVECTGYSVSEEQTRIARERCRDLPVQILLEDYRSIRGTYDRVVSIGMLEAVGYRNYRTFMQVVSDRLTDEGLALIHTVGHNRSTRHGDPWSDAYIFPNGMLPSIAQLGEAMEGLFVMEDWHNFGPDYDKTLMAWHERFQSAWPELSARHSARFKRMWELYLLGFAGGFRVRSWQLWQIVLSKPGRVQPDCRL